MRLRFAFLILCVVLGATAANAQFNAVLINEIQPLLWSCEDGAPLPDGTTIQIFWDSLGNGVTPDDRQPTEGPGFLQVNFNQFALNGVEIDLGPGLFGTDPYFTMVSGIPVPGESGHPLYWLRVCLDDSNIFWQSDTFRIQSGLNQVFFGPNNGQTHFTCVTGVCGGCQSPSNVFNLTASTTHCDSIVLTWSHDLVDIAGYRVLIDNEPPFIFIQNSATQRYVDLTSVGGQDHNYRVRAYRICGTGQDADTAYSTAVEVIGRKTVAPPVPQNMSASDNLCNTVKVKWSVNTVLGLDSIRVYRDGIQILSKRRTNAGNDSLYDNTPLAGVHEYCVRGYSFACSTGVAACDNGTAAGAPTCTISDVVAVGDCDEVCLTWTANCADVDSFRVMRNGALSGIVMNDGGTDFEYCHAPTAGQVGNYQIIPASLCGSGAAQPATPVQGTRLTVPGAVQGIAASDTLCDQVCITWRSMAGLDSFQIRQGTTRIGVVITAGNDTTFCFTGAVAGETHTYTVVAYNECGPGAVAGGNAGTRRAPGTGSATFALVTTGPPNWSYDMTVTSGCLNTVVIRDFCVGTTATAPAGWTVELDDDSIIFSSTEAYGATEVVTGFQLHHPTCDGDGRWSSGQSGGSIRGPLPVGDNALLPTEYAVNVYPNPFNPMTNFKIAVPQSSDTRIIVFNVMGQVVRDMNMGRLQAGYHTVQFGGAELPSGMYFARVQSGSFHSTHKLMLLK